MATTTITIPRINDKKRNGFITQISTFLDAGNDVELKDADGNEVNCTHINLADDGNVEHRTKDETDNEKSVLYYVKGGWHRVSASKFFAGGTDAALSIHIKFEDR